MKAAKYSTKYSAWQRFRRLMRLRLVVPILRSPEAADYTARGVFVGLLVALVAGFGLMARYPILWPWPGWLMVKMVLWLVFGASIVLLKRLPQMRTRIWWGAWGLFLVAAYLGVHRPF